MPIPSDRSDQQGERGLTLIEILIALVVLSLGVMAVAGIFPAGTRSQTSSRQLTTANYYAQQKLEDLQVAGWSDTALSYGRHPGGTATEALGTTGVWQRFYQVDSLPAPLDNLKRIAVSVSWNNKGTRTIRDTLYLRQ